MRIAFMGTPIFASRLLTAVHAAGHDVACVYAQPPAPRGRGQALQPSAVEVEAVRLGLKVRAPLSMRDPDVITAFRALELDAAVVVAYGQILTRPILDAPRFGAFNVHASLLPRWRGAAPIQRAILAGDRETGVQVMRMSEGLDEGPVLMTSRTIIDCEDTSGSLHDKLMAMAVELLPRALQSIETGTALETPQVDEGVTYAKKIKSSEARIDWSLPAVEIDRQIRGLSPWPGAWFMAQTPKGPLRVKALLSRVSQGRGAPGEVLDDQLQIACGESAVRLLRVQAEGRKIQDTEAFLRGQAIGDHVH